MESVLLGAFLRPSHPVERSLFLWANLMIHDTQLHYCILPRKVAKERGIKRYMTGKPCKRGHVCERWVAGNGCADCQYVYRTNEQKRKYLADYYAKNKEKMKERSREYRIKNKEKQDKWRRDWEEKNPEMVRSTKRAYKHRRRAAESGGPTSRQINEWFESQDSTCFYCGTDCSNGYHLDHFHALSRGGAHEIENLRVSCQRCNLSKGCQDPLEFIYSIGKKLVDGVVVDDIDCSDTTLAKRS